jgi:hypothetical protein
MLLGGGCFVAPLPGDCADAGHDLRGRGAPALPETGAAGVGAQEAEAEVYVGRRTGRKFVFPHPSTHGGRQARSLAALTSSSVVAATLEPGASGAALPASASAALPTPPTPPPGFKPPPSDDTLGWSKRAAEGGAEGEEPAFLSRPDVDLDQPSNLTHSAEPSTPPAAPPAADGVFSRDDDDGGGGGGVGVGGTCMSPSRVVGGCVAGGTVAAAAAGAAAAQLAPSLSDMVAQRALHAQWVVASEVLFYSRPLLQLLLKSVSLPPNTATLPHARMLST